MSHKSIKDETQALHKTLDQLRLNKRIMSKDVTMDDYKSFLIAQFNVYAFLKQHLKAIDSGFYESVKNRYSTLKKDLLKVGVEVYKIGLIPFEELTNTENKSVLLGLQYVLEGSRHGAVFIKKNLQNQLDLKGDFFHFLSYNSSVDWKELIERLDRENDTLHLKTGAIYAYKLFIASFKASS